VGDLNPDDILTVVNSIIIAVFAIVKLFTRVKKGGKDE